METDCELLTIVPARGGEAFEAAALRLYRRLGFRAIAPYTTNPVEKAVFLELQLDRSPS